MRGPLLLACLTASACNGLYVEAVVPNLCQHLTAQHFAVPTEVRARYAQLPDAGSQVFEFDKTFQFDVSLQLPQELQGVETSFSLSYVRITAVAPTTDFGFLDSAAVTLLPVTGSSLAPYTLSYTRTEANPTVIRWTGDGYDLSPFLGEGTLSYELAMLGTLPEGDVVADIDACASATAKVNYLAGR